MENKKILIWVGAIILVIIILIAGIYFFGGDKKIDEKQELSGNLGNLASKPVFALNQTISPKNLDYAYFVIESLNKEKCSEVTDEKLKLLCVNGIDLIEKALVAKNESACFDKSISVSTRVRVMCLQKFSNLNKTNN